MLRNSAATWPTSSLSTPSILSDFANPAVTPSTMFATSVRVRPCNALCRDSSDGRFTTTEVSSSVSAMSACSVRLISPFGPFTVIFCPSSFAVTPSGNATGFLPMRDIARLLPHHREQFAAHPGGARFAVRHESLRRAENRHAESVLHARDLARLDVAPEPGRRHALQLADDRRVVVVLQVEPQQSVLAIVQDLVVLDVMVVTENRGDRDFQLRHRHVDPAVPRQTGVAHAGQHIGDGINNAHACPLLPAGFAHAGNLPAQRQLTEADAAKLELAQSAAAAAAAPAAVVAPHLELRALLHSFNPRLLRHEVS